jgi:hypothetical protein
MHVVSLGEEFASDDHDSQSRLFQQVDDVYMRMRLGRLNLDRKTSTRFVGQQAWRDLLQILLENVESSNCRFAASPLDGSRSKGGYHPRARIRYRLLKSDSAVQPKTNW